MRRGILILFIAMVLFAGATSVSADNLGSASTIVSGIAGQAGATVYSTPQDLVGTGINAALTMVGLIFLILMIYAGYLWLTSHGEEEPVKKAQKIIVSSVIGFVLVVSAYAVTVFVGKRFEVGGGGDTTKEDECKKFDPLFACQDISLCKWGSKEEKTWANCTESNFCVQKKCMDKPDDNNYVCCWGQDQPAPEPEGDPSEKVCCRVCTEKLWGDFYDDPTYGWMSKTVCDSACDGQDKGECYAGVEGQVTQDFQCTNDGAPDFDCSQFETGTKLTCETNWDCKEGQACNDQGMCVAGS